MVDSAPLSSTPAAPSMQPARNSRARSQSNSSSPAADSPSSDFPVLDPFQVLQGRAILKAASERACSQSPGIPVTEATSSSARKGNAPSLGSASSVRGKGAGNAAHRKSGSWGKEASEVTKPQLSIVSNCSASSGQQSLAVFNSFNPLKGSGREAEAETPTLRQGAPLGRVEGGSEGHPAAGTRGSASPQRMRHRSLPLGLGTPLEPSSLSEYNSFSEYTSVSESTSVHSTPLGDTAQGSRGGPWSQGEAVPLKLAVNTVTALLAAKAAALGPECSPEKVVRKTYEWLAEKPEDAAELAALLYEAAPSLGVAADSGTPGGRPSKGQTRWASIQDVGSLRQRLALAVPADVEGQVPWSRLTHVASSESLQLEEFCEDLATAAGAAEGKSAPSPPPTSGEVIEVNSGGLVYFCFFSPPTSPPCSRLAQESLTPPQAKLLQHYLAQQQQLTALVADSSAAPQGPSTPLPGSAYQEKGQGQGPPTLAESPASATQTAVPKERSEAGNTPLPMRQKPLGDTASLTEDPPPTPSTPSGVASWCRDGPSLQGRERHRQEREQVLVLKIAASRLAAQSEKFANELTHHLGVSAPACRILRKGGSAAEWRTASEAAASLGNEGTDLEEHLARVPCVLLLEFIPGSPFFSAREPFLPDSLPETAYALGRLFLLDMLLGNADRLQSAALGWRGNPSNLLYCPQRGRIVAIDSAVQRRPPGGLKSVEDAACNKLTELVLNDTEAARQALEEAVSSSAEAQDLLNGSDVHIAFQQGLRASLEDTAHVKGLMEMMYDKLSGWIAGFVDDMQEVGASTARRRPSTPPLSLKAPETMTPAMGSKLGNGMARGPWGDQGLGNERSMTAVIRSIGREANFNELMSERLDHWKSLMRTWGEELRAAVDEWQAKRAQHSDKDPPALTTALTTAFLDGSHPIVDAYELKVRLAHMLQRLRVLVDAAATSRPAQLLPHLWVGGAVEASSLHLLRHLGITHVLNATEDLLLPEDSEGFKCLRCPLRDVEDEDITAYFKTATAFVEEAQQQGGAALVHCHEGKSRSVTLILAYLMQAQGWSLKEALDFVVARRRQAAPNAGFLAKLLALEEELRGSRSVQVKRTRPELRTCPICGEKAGISRKALAVHMRTKHPQESTATGDGSQVPVSKSRTSSTGSVGWLPEGAPV